MNKIFRLVVVLFSVISTEVMFAQQASLRSAVGKYCLIGSSLNQTQSAGLHQPTTDIVRRHFNTAVAENCMKGEQIQPVEGLFTFYAADQFVRYCEQNGLTPIGHCLVWHSQAPVWFFHDAEGQLVSREVMAQRIRTHIATVVGRYKGRIHGWDVCNEIIEDDGSFRNSYYYQILGEDFVEIAFRAAHEADPDAELYLNDFSMAKPAKREAYVRLIRQMKQKGLRIDAIGMQSHNGMNYPDLDEYEQSIVAFAAEGIKVNLTELDINSLPNPWEFSGAGIDQNFEYQEKMDPYKNGMPAEAEQAFTERYMQFFRLYYKHRDKIGRINLWGVSDSDTWLNDFPIKGRTNYSLLFDRQYQAKPVVNEIINLYK